MTIGPSVLTSQRISGRLYVILSQGGLLALNLGPALLIARELGPAATGVYAGVARIAALSLSLLSLSYAHGLAQVAAGGQPAVTAASWRGALMLSVPQGVIATALVWIAASILIDTTQVHASWFAAYFAGSMIFQFVILAGQHLLRGRQDFNAFSRNRLLQGTLWCAGCLLAYTLGALSLSMVGVVWTLSQVSTLIAVLLRVRATGVTWSGPIECRSSLRFGLRAHIGIVGRDIAAYVDQLVVVTFAGAVALGLYIPASTFSGLVLAVGVAMSLIIQPKVAASRDQDKGKLALRLIGQAAGASILMGLVCASTSRWLIPLVYGTAYRSSGDLGTLLSVAVIFDSIALAAISATLGMGCPARASAVQGLGTLLVVAVLVLVVARSGIGQVPIALLITYAVSSAAAMAVFWRCIPIADRRPMYLLAGIGGARWVA